jgi:hypothetical protein
MSDDLRKSTFTIFRKFSRRYALLSSFLVSVLVCLATAFYTLSRGNTFADVFESMMANFASSSIVLFLTILISTLLFELYDQIERDDSNRELKATLEEALTGFDARKKNVDGVIGMHVEMPYDKVVDRLQNGDEITIVNTFLPELQRVVDPSKYQNFGRKSFKAAFLHPLSPDVASRDRSLGSTQTKESIENSMEILRSFNGMKTLHSYEVYFLEQIPTFPCIIVDDVCFVGFFWGRRLAVSGVTFEIDLRKVPHFRDQAAYLLEHAIRIEDLDRWRDVAKLPI